MPEARAHEAVSITDSLVVAPQPAALPLVDQHRESTNSEEDMDDEERLAAKLESASLEEGRNAMGRRQRAKL